MTNTTTLDLSALATIIRDRYLPLVFSCGCAGSHEECARILREDAAVWAQHDTVMRIAKFIETYN